MNKYVEIMKVGTQYAKHMEFLRNRIFVEVARNTNEKSMKVVRMFSEEPVQKREMITNWYPRHVETYVLMKKLREYGLFRDEHEDFKEEMKRLRKLRGKSAPKKGEGKRSKK
ncbi:28S ribosomal protein S33, mitochondrial [Condylostylus longicornis]|uniref:28S ribosomal protein S33, mitochondrial n=1 Tax=Condylostylus longicornis TaxID=2530218 RepID=UPI00244DCE82|nr:28S ribosomal protein S33, mitochondrial [Condylostylus longicornis]